MIEDICISAEKGASNAKTPLTTLPDKKLSSSAISYHHARNKTGIFDSDQPNNNSNEFLKCWTTNKDAIKVWEKYTREEPINTETVQQNLIRHLITTLSRTHFNLDSFAAYQGVAHTLRDRLITSWNQTQQHHTRKDVKRVYYLSMEFLLGRSLDNALLNLGVKRTYNESLKQLDFNLEDLIGEEQDAALGNGGLGRLAACYMDSLATMNYPAWGYGLRYQYGIFKQTIVDGFQYESPDYWLNFDNPWEVPRLDVTYEIRFYGQVSKYTDSCGKLRYRWDGGETVQAVAYDVPIPGYETRNTVNIRLWSSKPTKKFDLTSFNAGEYTKSVEEQQKAENITSVLYPNDNTMAGKELRLKQQYFFVSATLKDIVRRFKKTPRSWDEFETKVAVQLNDTHPTLAIPELQRILVDKEGLDWDHAWSIVQRVFAFTNHTVLPEALEKWNLDLLQRLLPRHMMIVYDINLYFLQKVEKRFPHEREKLARMSIIEEHPNKMIRMAWLAVVGSHTVNGVAKIHSQLIKKEIFADFVDFYGEEKFQNKTNGITQRRWLLSANPLLAHLISNRLKGDDWVVKLDLLQLLKVYSSDPQFQQQWMAVKEQNKKRLSDYIQHHLGVNLDPQRMLFDVQVKRIHEYKRQFMNILGVIHRYLLLKERLSAHLFGPAPNGANDDGRKAEWAVPRAVIFGGKAAPGYQIAKLVIKLINSVAKIINADPITKDYLKVVFVPDYNVSLAEIIVPASDISEHISTAGTEASGTSNMKFVLNGGLIIGTLDGANVEIMEEVGEENIFIFGCKADQVADLRHYQKYYPTGMNENLSTVINTIKTGLFCPYEDIAPLIDTLTVGGDFYLVSHDFASYLRTQERIDLEYKNKMEWARKSIHCTASMGKFSSDRAIDEYAQNIWNLERCSV